MRTNRITDRTRMNSQIVPHSHPMPRSAKRVATITGRVTVAVRIMARARNR